jgi:hypothetical protein
MPKSGPAGAKKYQIMSNKIMPHQNLVNSLFFHMTHISLSRFPKSKKRSRTAETQTWRQQILGQVRKLSEEILGEA